MNPNREEALFALALEKPADKRPAFLDAMCEGDAVLRARLEALLAAHEQPDGALPTQAETPREVEFTDEAPDEAVGQTLGRYKLLEKIGEGGCGVVYVAEQTEPVRRRVALKVIKLGMDTKQVVARFEAERQALAMMDHPNIAKVLDAGTTEGVVHEPEGRARHSVRAANRPSESGAQGTDAPYQPPSAVSAGRPYFVMELVRGIKITDYCDQNNLSTKARLDLFIKVCQAIQHAHQKGIIHRDIKPSNILVTLHDGVPVPKVIDFGIAKATEGRLTDATVYTQLHQFIGTPAYMSPEQAEMSGLDIDTRSDIYSLGVLLYELLAGSTPFDAKDLMASGIDAMRKTIREKEPLRPSTKLAALKGEELTTTAKRRSSDAPRLIHLLKGDLDWIVMKCLEKDRTRRYETANGLAADLKRHLTNEPVTARPPSAGYRLQKAFRRNRLMFTAAGVVTASVLLGLTASVWMFLRERAAKAEADAARTEEFTQRQTAQANEQTARQAEQKANLERGRALQATEDLRRHIYVAEMGVVHQAIREGNLARARHLLDNHRPKAGESDMRGFEWRYLWQLAQGDSREVLGDYLGLKGALALSPDGRFMAYKSESENHVRILDLASRTMATTLPAEDHVGALRFSPDGTRLVGMVGKQLFGWDARTWKVLGPLPGRFPLVFAPDSRTFFAVDEEERFSIWSTDSWMKLTGLPDTKPISSQAGWASDPAIAVTSDGRHLYYLGERWLIRGWDLELNRELPPIEIERDTLVTGLAIAPDRVMAISTWDGSVRLWALDSRQWLANFQEHLSWISGLKFSNDGSRLISASADQTCAIYDRKTQTTRRLRGHTTEIWAMDISADGNSLVTGAAYGGTIIRWLLDSANSKTSDDAAVTVVLQSTDGRLLRYRHGATDYERFDLASGRTEPAGMSRLGPLVRHPGSPSDAASAGGEWHRVSPDTRWVLTGPGDKPVAWLWNARSGEKARMLTNQWGRVTWGLLSDDGAYAVISGINSEVRLYRTADWTSEVLIERSGDKDARKEVHAFFSRDSKRLAIDGVGEGVVVVDIRSKAVVNRFATPTGFLAVAFSNAGRYLAYGGADNLIRIFDLHRGEPLLPLTGHAAGVWGLAFAPDDRTLASAGDKRIKLWNVESRQEIFTLHLGDRNPTRLSFSSDGCHLVSHDPYQVWTAPSWEEIAAAEAKERAQAKQP